MTVAIDRNNEMLDSLRHDLKITKHISGNATASILAGLLFAVAWWLVIDMSCQYPSQAHFDKRYYLMGIVATLALILANSISNSKVLGNNMDNRCCLNQCSARILLFLSFILAFASLIASGWLLFGYYIIHKKHNLYPGIVIFAQNVAIFISTLILKFGRTEDVNY